MTYLPKIGLLGGGQLGRMLLQVAANWDLEVHVLDPNPEAPARGLTPHFVRGDFSDYDTVYAFGQSLDLLTIEIEKVNTEALQRLAQEGKKVYPQPEIIALIQDKRRQKAFYREAGIPTADYLLTETRADVAQHLDFLPAFHKLGQGGYDGRGVQYLASPADLSLAFEAPGLLEKAVAIHKELAVLVARNPSGEVTVFPPVEMVFDPRLNLVDYLLSPAQLTPAQAQEAQLLARTLIEKWQMVGLLAVEMFLTTEGQLLVNEVAPRPHNSGHASIEANYCSQFEQHLRAILDWPLGNPASRQAAAMVNLLGEAGHEGPTYYEGLSEALGQPEVFVHLYGKKITQPGRKMGHLTLLAENPAALPSKVAWARQMLKVKSAPPSA